MAKRKTVKRASAKKTRPRRWSQEVTRRSDALDLESGVFTSTDPAKIARSLKRSAEHSTRRKAKPFQSAMSMLNLYINRAGHSLPASNDTDAMPADLTPGALRIRSSSSL